MSYVFSVLKNELEWQEMICIISVEIFRRRSKDIFEKALQRPIKAFFVLRTIAFNSYTHNRSTLHLLFRFWNKMLSLLFEPFIYDDRL